MADEGPHAVEDRGPAAEEVERVARAIFAALHPTGSWSMAVPRLREEALIAARVGIVEVFRGWRPRWAMGVAAPEDGLEQYRPPGHVPLVLLPEPDEIQLALADGAARIARFAVLSEAAARNVAEEAVERFDLAPPEADRA